MADNTPSEATQPTSSPNDDSTGLFLVSIRLIFSILLAYPLSGALYVIVAVIRNLSWFWQHMDVAFIGLVFWIIAVPSCGGFVPSNEGDVGPRINMYPWIIPTAATLFFLLSKGWQWFSHKR